MTRKNYYVISPNVRKDESSKIFEKEMFENHIVLMGWDRGTQRGNMFANMEKGDIVIVAQGSNKQKRTCFAGIIDSESDTYNARNGETVSQYRKIKYFTNLTEENIPFDNNCTYGSSAQIPAIYRLNNVNNCDLGIINAIDRCISETQLKENMEKFKSLLEAKHNIILHGAPGTGKTYTARNLAAYMTCGIPSYDSLSEEEKKKIGFVQFHPSYDYTDFVEGLRPTPPDDKGNIGFERKDGVFKEFCKNAVKSEDKENDNFEDVWTRLIEELSDTPGGIKVNNISNKGIFTVTLNVRGTGLMNPNMSGGYFSKEQLYNVYRGMKGTKSGAFDNYRRAIIQKLYDDYELNKYSPVGGTKGEEKKYVFIIDEINRGDMSKIFGELFFSIDPGYRGKVGKVKTQYQNLVEYGDEFEDGFYVPENVYIVGTMNDIDRSVESMDFAMRRRFTFKEITAKASADSMGIQYDGSYLESLNKAIREKANLSRDYEIGASYVKDYGCYMIKDSDKIKRQELWDNSLCCLVKEYLRGTGHEDVIKELANAFGVDHNED